MVTLDADTVMSETAATSGAHSCLDYLPGASLLGVCAASLYKDLVPEESFIAFHSGKVRFGNAYPLADNGTPAIPVPAAWHCFKGERPSNHGMLASGIINQISYKMTEEDEKRQPKQIREGYFTLCGYTPEIRTGYRLKTAVDRKSKRAAESQLFGYEYLTAGSRWWFELCCDDDLDKGLVNKIKTALTGNIRLGRSRTAEFGQATVTAIEAGFRVSSKAESSDILTLYCLSDLALRELCSGSPTMIPDGQQFGLEGTVLDSSKSFIRTRSYAPFNGTRLANDLERQVIAKGSVISFRKTDGQTFTETELSLLGSRIAAGTGCYLQDGLGRILLNPSFLAADCFVPADSTPLTPAVTLKKDNSYTSELTEWLCGRSVAISGDKEIVEQVEKWAVILKKGMRTAEKYPGNSQWGIIRSVSGTRAEIEQLLFSQQEGKKGFCHHGVSKEYWQAEFRYGDTWISFADFLKEVVLASYTDDASACRALQLLGSRMPRILNQTKGDNNYA